jgi:hypothetical protein
MRLALFKLPRREYPTDGHALLVALHRDEVGIDRGSGGGVVFATFKTANENAKLSLVRSRARTFKHYNY